MGTAANMLTDRDAVVMQEPDMRRHLIAIVAGFAAEKIEFGVVSTGVHDDLHAATGLARQMVTSYGMSRGAGPGDDRREGRRGLPRRLAAGARPVGPATLELIDREVERIVGDAVDAGRSDPAAQLERRLRDRQRAGRARDALRRRARRRPHRGQADPARLRPAPTRDGETQELEAQPDGE